MIENIKMHLGLSIIWFSIALFIYLCGCGICDIMPFTHKKIIATGNISCGENEKQISGYCCETQEQYNSGDCTKK